MYVMVSMELDDEEQLDMCCPIPVSDRPRFPWGLRITLTDAEFRKLKLDPTDAFVGGTIHGHFMARITSCSANETEGGEQHRIELQIEDLCIESEDAENAEAEAQ